MDVAAAVETLRQGRTPAFPAEAKKRGFAEEVDALDKLRHLRGQFNIPTKRSLRKKALDCTCSDTPISRGQMLTAPAKANGDVAAHCNGHQNGLPNGDAHSDDEDSPCLYLVGNSLGAQPKAVRQYLDAQLETWASIGVGGHFNTLEDSPLVAWQDMAEDCARKSADIVGASPREIVIMNTLTANLHFMMASFYRPSAQRHKIILEWKPFPSDWVSLPPTTRKPGQPPV